MFTRGWYELSKMDPETFFPDAESVHIFVELCFRNTEQLEYFSRFILAIPENVPLELEGGSHSIAELDDVALRNCNSRDIKLKLYTLDPNVLSGTIACRKWSTVELPSLRVDSHLQLFEDQSSTCEEFEAHIYAALYLQRAWVNSRWFQENVRCVTIGYDALLSRLVATGQSNVRYCYRTHHCGEEDCFRSSMPPARVVYEIE